MMDTADIENSLVAKLEASIRIPRYYAPNWWECDVVEITQSGYFVEYEVKISLADYKADASKIRSVYDRNGRVTRKELKHDLLAAGHELGPSRFWYVAPAGIIPLCSLPDWAGLMEVTSGGFQVSVNAPRIHNKKVTQEFKDNIFRNCYFRYHDLRKTIYRNYRKKRDSAKLTPMQVVENMVGEGDRGREPTR